MGPPPLGFRLVFDAAPFEAQWVLLPGVALWAVSFGLLLVFWRGSRGQLARAALGGGAALLTLAAVWWTLGGVGAWRAGAGRLANGTADYAEGTLEAPPPPPGGTLQAFEVAGQHFQRAPDAFAPALHATRWPSLRLKAGQRVRVWFFGADLLRVEAQAGPDAAVP